MKWILILFSTFAIKSCGISNASNLLEKGPIILTELNDTYRIKTLNNKDLSLHKLIISFDNETKQASEFSVCNLFFINYELVGESLKFEALGSTRMMCDEEANEIENEFHQTINKVNKIISEGDSITLLNNKLELITATKEIINNSIIFEYSTSTRGSYKSIKVDSSAVFTSNKRSSNPIGKKYSKEKWNNLLALLKAIDLDRLSELIPPSKDHQFDGATLAHFKIIKGNNIYEVQPFDHGRPHLIIEPLVKEIVSISENIE